MHVSFDAKSEGHVWVTVRLKNRNGERRRNLKIAIEKSFIPLQISVVNHKGYDSFMM